MSFSPAYARAGGGCFLPDTLILAANGTLVPIGSLKSGDVLLAFTENEQIVNVSVDEAYGIEVDGYYVIGIEKIEVKVTGEHPFYVGDGKFKVAEEIEIGDYVFVFNGTSLSRQMVVGKRKVNESGVKVYNLRTGWPNTYFANFIAVHNKGGGGGGGGGGVRSSSSKHYESPYREDTYCGAVKTFELKNGSKINGSECIYVHYHKTQSPQATRLSDCVRTNSDSWKQCESLAGFALSHELQFRCANDEECAGLDYIELKNGMRVKVIKPLVTFDCCTCCCVGIFFMAFGLFFVGGIANSVLYVVSGGRLGFRPYRTGENLDYCYSPAQIDAKVARTKKLLDYLAGIDRMWEPELLKKTARETFTKMQRCWEARDYSEMRPLMMPYLYAQHVAQIESMKRNHEINKLEGLEIRRVDIVHLRHYAKKNQQEFTALVEASVRDYYVDDRTGAFLRGDKVPATFQEFLVFQRQEDRWLLREINQTRESDALRAENFVEELTPLQLQNIYGSAAQKPTEKAPWLDDSLAQKGEKVHRMLNFLSTTDKSWDEDFMKESARRIFVEVLSAFEKRDISALAPYLMPEALEFYNGQIGKMKEENRTIEYRNMCVRKVEIILVKNFADSDKDEFTCRISAHAQKIERKGGVVVHRDPDVVPFEEYLTFQKQKGEWKLREVQPPARAHAMIVAENVDEEVSKEQVQWYYTKDRAL
ncbi:MAG: TIM44-like domain-containing protein [Candidatus Micrarchaeia archaeon]